MAGTIVVDSSLAIKWVIDQPYSAEAALVLAQWGNEDLQLLQRAQFLAYRVGRPATYDDVYAALAEREGSEFWTANERYWNAVKSRRPWVRCIADPSLPLRAAASP